MLRMASVLPLVVGRGTGGRWPGPPRKSPGIASVPAALWGRLVPEGGEHASGGLGPPRGPSVTVSAVRGTGSQPSLGEWDIGCQGLAPQPEMEPGNPGAPGI